MDENRQEPAAAVQSLRASIAKLARRLRSERRVQSLNFTPLIILGRLVRTGPASATDLSRLERIQPQSLTRVLALLEREGLISRTADPADGRRLLIAATPKGAHVLQEDGKERAAWLAAAMQAALTPCEQEVLLIAGKLMDKLADLPNPAETAD